MRLVCEKFSNTTKAKPKREAMAEDEAAFESVIKP
jgi:hypothetical protein